MARIQKHSQRIFPTITSMPNAPENIAGQMNVKRLSEGAKQIQQFANKMQDLKNLRQQTEASLSYNEQLNDIRTRASQDSTDNFHQYEAEINKLVNNAGANIQDAHTRGLFKMKAGQSAQVRLFEMKAENYRKEVNMLQDNIKYLEASYNAVDGQDEKLKKEILGTMDLFAKKTNMNSKATKAMKDTFLKNAQEKDMNNLLYKDPEAFIANAEAGVYNFESSEEKQKYLNTAHAQKKKNKANEKINIYEGDAGATLDFANKYLQGELDPNYLLHWLTIRETTEGDVPLKADIRRVFMGALNEPHPDHRAKGVTYTQSEEFLEDFKKTLDGNMDALSSAQLVVNVTKKFSKGQLGASQYKYFIQSVKQINDKRVKRQKHINSPWAKALNKIESVTSKFPVSTAINPTASILFDAIEKADSDKDLDKIVDESLTSFVNTYYDSMYVKSDDPREEAAKRMIRVGKIVKGKDGRRKILSPYTRDWVYLDE